MQPPHVESHKAQSIGQESKQKPWVNQNNLTHSDEKHHASKKLKIWLDPDAWRHLLELSSKKKTKPELKLRKGSHVLQTNNAVLRISMEGRAYQDLGCGLAGPVSNFTSKIFPKPDIVTFHSIPAALWLKSGCPFLPPPQRELVLIGFMNVCKTFGNLASALKSWAQQAES